jgi:RNA polymerase sigma factor (sigma-70 family)
MRLPPDPSDALDREDPGWRERTYKAFYTECNTEVYRIVQHVTQDPSLAEEATQEAFSRAFQWWETIEPAKRRAWVIQVAINYRRSWWREWWRRRAREEHRFTRYLSAVPADPYEHVLIVEARAALARLPRRQREVMTLRYLADLDAQETAAILGISVNTVGVHEHRARQRLRALLDDQGESRNG